MPVFELNIRWLTLIRLEIFAGDLASRLPRNMQVASDGDVTVIDSRCGEDFAVFQHREGANDAIAPQFDACASWWTQVFTYTNTNQTPNPGPL